MKKGILFSLLASLLFGFLYYYPTLLQPLTGEEIFGWRVLSTVICSFILLNFNHGWRQFIALFRRIPQQPLLLLGIVLSGALLGVQMWLFVWAPLHGRALSTSLGYFLLPLMMVLAGRLIYRESLSRFQLLAVSFATIGVVHEIYILAAFSWDTALVAIGFTLYFINRRYFKIEGLAGLFSDMVFTLPYGCYFIFTDPKLPTLFNLNPHFCLLIPMLGIITVIALFCYLTASRLLPLSLFGLLGYVEPLLLFIVAIGFLGEYFYFHQLWTYIPIWLAILFLVAEGGYKFMRKVS